MKKNINKMMKNEKGAITLFVLMACLFFVFILSTTYISNMNKLQIQESQYGYSISLVQITLLLFLTILESY